MKIEPISMMPGVVVGVSGGIGGLGGVRGVGGVGGVGEAGILVGTVSGATSRTIRPFT
jgi:hypothetical protein